MDETETKQIAIVLYPGLTVLDAIGPYEILKTLPGAELRFVAHEPGPIVADSGVLALGATHSFHETPSPYLFLVPGSEANTLTAMADGKLLAWLRQAHETSAWSTSVCTGSCVLAAAGILEGRPATTHWAAQEYLARFGAEPQRDQRIVRSGKIWTAAGVSAGIDLALALYGEICGQDAAEVAQLMIEYDPQPPYDAGHMSKARPEIAKRALAEVTARAKNPRDALSFPTVIWRRTLDKIRRART